MRRVVIGWFAVVVATVIEAVGCRARLIHARFPLFFSKVCAIPVSFPSPAPVGGFLFPFLFSVLAGVGTCNCSGWWLSAAYTVCCLSAPLASQQQQHQLLLWVPP
jgi:hypothetical protein